MSGDVTLDGRGLDHSGPFAQAAILSSENLESPSSPSPGLYPSSCLCRLQADTTRRLPAPQAFEEHLVQCLCQNTCREGQASHDKM